MENLQAVGAIVVVVLGVLGATPPVIKKLRPIFSLLRNYALADVLKRLDRLETHSRAKSPHLNRKERRKMNKMMEENHETL